MKNAKVIAYYLPQFHPVAENDEWWGKGFTEWTNVGRAKRLFRGHYQPRVPADLGYYDLRLPEVREQQANLAKEAGVEAFCYWHYWFGEGKQLLEMPINEVVKTKKPDFPFCVAWANHSWMTSSWSVESKRFDKRMIAEQKYLGKADYEAYFYSLLEAFKDPRYYKIDGKLCFVIYDVDSIPDFDVFLETWKALGVKNNLPEFFFISHTLKENVLLNEKHSMCDAINLSLLHKTFELNRPGFIQRSKLGSWLYTKYESIVGDYTNKPKNIVKYSKAIKSLSSSVFKEEKIFPTIVPNWDTTPRAGGAGRVFQDSTPKLFASHVNDIFNLIKGKKDSQKIVFLKSWNEWAEGNHLEPDLKYGKGYIQALKQEVEKE